MIWYFLIVSFLIFLFSLILLIKRLVFITNAVKVPGRIISYDKRPFPGSEEGLFMYIPSVSYTALDGKKYTYTSDSGLTDSRPEVDSIIFLWYDPLNPKKALLDGFKFIWQFPVGMMVFGSMIFTLLLYQTGYYLDIYNFIKDIWGSLNVD